MLVMGFEEVIKELRDREEEARRIRRAEADWDFINSLPPRVKLAVIHYIETGDIYVSARIAGMSVEEFNEVRIRRGFQMPTDAIADTSFIIDWVRYSGRDLLFRLFSTVWIPEPVLNEVRSENSLSWITGKLAEGKFALFPELTNYRDEALRLMELSSRYPVRRLDYPEAYCIAVASDRGYVVLSENGGAMHRNSSTPGPGSGGPSRFWRNYLGWA